MFDTSAAKEKFLTPDEIAKEWRCTPHHIRNLINAGQLRGFRVGAKMIVRASDAATYLERSATAKVAA